MSHLTHGGRIVPILTGHQQHPESTVAEMVAVRNKPLEDILLLQDQQEDASAAKTRQSKALDRESLEMPCLKARGLFALPTEGDGKLAIGCAMPSSTTLGRISMCLSLF